MIDIRTQPYIEIKDLYTKDGKHVSSVAKTPDGREVWSEGRIPSKDLCFVEYLQPAWNKAWS